METIENYCTLVGYEVDNIQEEVKKIAVDPSNSTPDKLKNAEMKVKNGMMTSWFPWVQTMSYMEN